jgi:proteasome lid subunit RPN8/RPN11
MARVSMSTEDHSAMMRHLSRPHVEHVAFLFTAPAQSSKTLRVCEIYPVPNDGFDFQSHMHVELTDEVRARVIKRAHDIGGSLVEVHSHLGGPARFSASDLAGFEDWVPHVRWRLADRPYVAIVFSGEAFDALVWEGDARNPAPLDRLEVDDCPPRAPSRLTFRRKRWHWR